MHLVNGTYSDQVPSFNISNSRNYLLLFILWPFLACLTALANFSQKEARVVVYMFLIYYGLNFVIPDTGYVDAMGYANELRINASLPFSAFFKILGGLYTEDSSVDIYEHLISFIVSRLTTDHRFLFGVFAAVFGFFYLKSINIINGIYRQNPNWNSLVHLFFFCVILPITLINGVRMWTAAWIFFYGAIHVIMDRDKRYLLVALSSSLVHFSFLSANIVLLIYFFAGNRNLIYLPIAISSFFLPQLLTPIIKSIGIGLGGSLQARVEGYSNEEWILGVQEHREQNTWFMQLGNDLVFYYLIVAIIIIQIVNRNSFKEKAERNLFSFLLLFISFVNFGVDIPSFGGRFKLVFFLFGTVYMILYFRRRNSSNINLLTLIGIFPMLLYAAVTFRIGSDSINSWIFAPGLGLPLFTPILSIADLLFN